jgi:hypothetical protein
MNDGQSNATWLKWRSECYGVKKDFNKALEEIKSALKFDPENTGLLFKKSIFKMKAKQKTKVYHEISRLIKDNNNNADAYLIRALEGIKMGI